LQVEKGVAKQIPQLQPKAKERKSKKEECGRGVYRRRRGCVRGSARTHMHVRADALEMGIRRERRGGRERE
jgi:hypothetical protein